MAIRQYPPTPECSPLFNGFWGASPKWNPPIHRTENQIENIARIANAVQWQSLLSVLVWRIPFKQFFAVEDSRFGSTSNRMITTDPHDKTKISSSWAANWLFREAILWNRGIGDAGSTADIRMLWSAMVCYSLPWLLLVLACPPCNAGCRTQDA